MKTKLIPFLSVISVLLLACMLSGCGQSQQAPKEVSPIDDATIRENFLRDAQTVADSFIQGNIDGNYEVAIEFPYYKPGNESHRARLRSMLENDGDTAIGYEIYEIVQHSDVLYQIDGEWIDAYDVEEIYNPYYFLLDGEWHFTLNKNQLPDGYLDGITPITDPGILVE